MGLMLSVVHTRKHYRREGEGGTGGRMNGRREGERDGRRERWGGRCEEGRNQEREVRTEGGRR